MMKFFVTIISTVILLGPNYSLAWKVKRNQFNPAMISRYKGMLSSAPDDGFAFRKLVGLYTTYSSMDALIIEYRRALKRDPENYSLNVVIGRLYLKIDRFDEAVSHLEKAQKKDPARFESYKNLGNVFVRKRKFIKAKGYLDKALSRVKGKVIRQRLLKELVRLTVIGGDIKNGVRYFDMLLALRPGDFQTRWDFASLLVQGMHFEKAMKQYKKLYTMSYGDSRRKVEILKAMGDTSERMGEDKKAVKTYWKAMSMTASGHWIRRELVNKLVSISRRRDELHLLINDFKRRWGKPTGFQYSIMAKIYGEIGQFDKAAELYRRAIRNEPSNVDYRSELIALLEKSGASPEVIIREQKALADAAPGQIKFSIELAKRYEKAGNKNKALSITRNLLAKNPSDAGLYLALADLYAQWNKPDKVIKMYEKLVVLEPLDYEHYVNLGQQYWGRGKRKKAISTWKKILKKGMFPVKEDGFFIISGLFLETQQFNEAKNYVEMAISGNPQNTKYLFLRSQVEIKLRQPEKALLTLEKALKISLKSNDVVTVKKIRKNLLKLWKDMGVLEKKLSERLRKWRTSNISQGMFLAEGFTTAGNVTRAEKIYLRMRKANGAMSEPLLGLISLYESIGKYGALIKLLEEAVKLIPHRARDFYEQLSNTWAILGNDIKARQYLRKALEKGARDSKSWAKAGDLAIKLEDYRGAIKAFLEAIRLDPYEMDYYFSLASLYVQLAEVTSASKVYYSVISRSSEDDLVEKAARAACDLDELTGNLGKLEKVLHPLSFVYAHRSVFGKMLLEVYKRYVPWLYSQIRNSTSIKEKKYLTREIHRLRTRALKPLLESLTGEESLADKEIARSLLAQLGNPNSAVPIIRLAKRMFEQGNKKNIQGKPTKLSSGEKDFIRKSVYIASEFKTNEISRELKFFASQETDKVIQVIALRGLSLINTSPSWFATFLNKYPSVSHATAGCAVAAREKRYHSKIYSIIRDTKIPPMIRIGCMKGIIAYGDSSKNSELMKIISDTDPDYYIRKNTEKLLSFVIGKKDLPFLISHYLNEKNESKSRWLRGILETSGVIKSAQKNLQLGLDFNSSSLESEVFNLIKSQTGKKLIEHGNFINISGKIQSVRLITEIVEKSHRNCPDLTGYLNLMEKQLTSKNLKNFISIWNDDLSLRGMDRICNSDTRKYGIQLWNKMRKQIISSIYISEWSVKRRLFLSDLVSGNITLMQFVNSNESIMFKKSVLTSLGYIKSDYKTGGFSGLKNTPPELKFIVYKLYLAKNFDRKIVEQILKGEDFPLSIAVMEMISERKRGFDLLQGVLSGNSTTLATKAYEILKKNNKKELLLKVSPKQIYFLESLKN
ncbi:MAG: tetratricopeptide repeat protein [Deltaproteobacteria bacterium]|nr:tetratricopeptide repeat protein [Deltaproteobacteria bacterium]